MLFKPLLGTDLSGKLGGIVASHNRGGAYFRAATIPTNPNTPQQQAVRTAVASLTSAWQNILTQVQRDAWQVYADNVQVTNRIGEQVNISGLAMLVRSGVARIQVLLAAVLDAPTTFNLGSLTRAFPGGATEAAQTVNIAFGGTIPLDPWLSETGSWMFVYVSRPQNAGIKFFKGPYRFAGSVQGDPSPPVSPLVVNVPFAITEGQRIFTRAVVSLVDGRFTTPIFGTVLVAA